MEKVFPTSIRLSPSVKAALARAARDDERSVSSFAERILKAWLAGNGYLPAPAEGPPRTRRAEKVQ